MESEEGVVEGREGENRGRDSSRNLENKCEETKGRKSAEKETRTHPGDERGGCRETWQ